MRPAAGVLRCCRGRSEALFCYLSLARVTPAAHSSAAPAPLTSRNLRPGPSHSDALLLCYLKDAKTELQLHSLASGKLQAKVPLPIGSVVSCSVKRDYSEVFLQFMSFLNPGTIYRLETSDPAALDLRVVRQSKVNDLDPADYKTEQVFVKSRDGTKVPMFIVSHKDFVRDGTNCALLYGYGGFSISLSPFFKVSNMCFVRSFGAREGSVRLWDCRWLSHSSPTRPARAGFRRC